MVQQTLHKFSTKDDRHSLSTATEIQSLTSHATREIENEQSPAGDDVLLTVPVRLPDGQVEQSVGVSSGAAVTVECLPLVPAQGGEVEQSVGVSSGAAVTVECLPLVPAQGDEVEQSVGVSSGAAVTVECLPLVPAQGDEVEQSVGCLLYTSDAADE